MANIANIETTITHSETEALLLEHNYIKENQPKYNVLLRDDKSYPYILLTKHKHPRLTAFRGSKKIAGEYFGPYPNVTAVRETLNLLQKFFLFVSVKILIIKTVHDLAYSIRSDAV